MRQENICIVRTGDRRPGLFAALGARLTTLQNRVAALSRVRAKLDLLRRPQARYQIRSYATCRPGRGGDPVRSKDQGDQALPPVFWCRTQRKRKTSVERGTAPLRHRLTQLRRKVEITILCVRPPHSHRSTTTRVARSSDRALAATFKGPLHAQAVHHPLALAAAVLAVIIMVAPHARIIANEASTEVYGMTLRALTKAAKDLPEQQYAEHWNTRRSAADLMWRARRSARQRIASSGKKRHAASPHRREAAPRSAGRCNRLSYVSRGQGCWNPTAARTNPTRCCRAPSETSGLRPGTTTACDAMPRQERDHPARSRANR